MQVFRGVYLHGSHVKVLQNIQYLDDVHAACAGGCHSDNLVIVAVCCLNRFTHRDFIIGQVLQSNQTAGFLNGADNRFRNGAGVKGALALVTDFGERFGQIRVLQNIPYFKRKAFLQVYAGGCRIPHDFFIRV